jgi:L-iditol 2-dehydrogenase
VAFAHHVPDYGSYYSQHGSETMDPQFKRTNIDPGGMAELIRVPALQVQNTVFPVPESMPSLRAIFMEPLACCVRAMDRVPAREGDTALVVGVGAVGILFIPLLRDHSLHILGMDLRQERLDAAARFDPSLVPLLAGQDVSTLAHTRTEGRGADLVVLTATNPALFSTALSSVRDGGTILLFGGKPGVELAFDGWNLLAREINLITSYSSTPFTLRRALAILERDEYALEQLVDPVLKLDQAALGFELAYKAQASKVAIVP